jgi:hypothetical protein
VTNDYSPKINSLLSHATGWTPEDFAKLAIAAADQAGMSGDDQAELRSMLSCRVCHELAHTDGLCLECEERQHVAKRAKTDRARTKAPRNERNAVDWRSE